MANNAFTFGLSATHPEVKVPCNKSLEKFKNVPKKVK